MKKTVFIFFLLSITKFIGQNKLEKTGKVGIGTKSPTEILQIGNFRNNKNLKLSLPGVYNFEQVKLGQYGNGSCGLELVNHSNRSNSYGVRLYSNTDNGVQGLQIQTAPSVDSYKKLNYTTRLAINENGNVGIGTIKPDAKLHVFNGDNSYGAILANSSTEPKFSLYTKTLKTQPQFSESFRLGLKYKNDERNGYISFYRGGGTNGGFLGLSTNGKERIRIAGNGNVSIGTDDSKGYNLAVAGKKGIISEEVTVKLKSNWPDYVFKKDYRLPSLAQVEKHIKEKGYLKDIPSAKEVAKNGVKLGEINKKLLQKIEELTLYTIQQQKEIDSQKKVILLQRAKNSNLENRLSKLENLILSKSKKQ